MERKQKAEKKAPVVKKDDKKKEIPEKELDKISGGIQAQRDRVGHGHP
ncbi:MAG: bacteriocin [Eubacteriales bacterium]|nr:bacteriocin [Eubacteriales bacterium]